VLAVQFRLRQNELNWTRDQRAVPPGSLQWPGQQVKREPRQGEGGGARLQRHDLRGPIPEKGEKKAVTKELGRRHPKRSRVQKKKKKKKENPKKTLWGVQRKG